MLHQQVVVGLSFGHENTAQSWFFACFFHTDSLNLLYLDNDPYILCILILILKTNKLLQFSLSVSFSIYLASLIQIRD